MATNKVYPGKHPTLNIRHFSSDEEKKIVDTLSKEFFITNGGKEILVGNSSEYKYLIISPTEIYKDMFNLNREIIVLFSPYEKIEARTLSVFDGIAQQQSALRIEKICNILISNDANVENSLNNLIKNEPESQIVIPFFNKELIKVDDPYFFRNRFRKYFYTRDLFAFAAPLKKDIYFFGRNDLIQAIINRYKSNENSGLFGLRKTGKTSLINGIERNLQKEGILPIVIDCQDPSFNQRRWNQALYYLCKKTNGALKKNVPLKAEEFFTDKDASELTENFLLRYKAHTHGPILYIFDEIENITMKTSPADHWTNGNDFILFWQALRSIFQRNDNLISYLIVGTNPACIETPKIHNVDNPIFNHFDPIYIPGFSVEETRDMVRKLGKRMGISFDECVYGRLTEDFGGHPFLMRHVCSLISKEFLNHDRPVEIGRAKYVIGKDNFISNSSDYMDMIVNILKDFYPDEYDMLVMLALDDDDFNAFSIDHPSYTAHLMGYGLIKRSNGIYDFNIDAMKNYITNQSRNKYKRKVASNEDMWAEISKRRNVVEVKLRDLVKISLQATFGASEAKNKVLDIFGANRKDKLGGFSYDKLFDASVSEIYFSDLSKIISKHWDTPFGKMFTKSKKKIFDDLEWINKSRADAHAKSITQDQFTYFRVCMASIEEDLGIE